MKLFNSHVTHRKSQVINRLDDFRSYTFVPKVMQLWSEFCTPVYILKIHMCSTDMPLGVKTTKSHHLRPPIAICPCTCA